MSRRKLPLRYRWAVFQKNKSTNDVPIVSATICVTNNTTAPQQAIPIIAPAVTAVTNVSMSASSIVTSTTSGKSSSTLSDVIATTNTTTTSSTVDNAIYNPFINDIRVYGLQDPNESDAMLAKLSKRMNDLTTSKKTIKKKKKRKRQFSVEEKKTFLITNQIIKKYKVTTKDWLNELNKKGIKIKRSTFFYWQQQQRKGLLKELKNETRGRKKKLSGEERKLLRGFCFWMARQNNTLNPRRVKKIVKIFSGKIISDWTANRFLKEEKFSPKRQLAKQSGYDHNFEYYLEKAKIWFKNNHAHIKNVNPSKLMSIDFTYTSHRAGKQISWSPVGSRQPKKKHGYTRYTDCVITCCWANGKISVALYSFNPGFKTIEYWTNLSLIKSKTYTITKRRKTIHNEFNRLLKELNLDENLICLLDDESSTKTFVRESQELVAMWLKNHIDIIENESIILHDSGTALNSIQLMDEFKKKNLKTIEYESDIHELLSPNDNKWHGVSKKKWRVLRNRRMLDKTQGVESSLLLVRSLLDIKKESIKKYFKKNLFFGQNQLNVDSISKMILEDKNFVYRSEKNIESMRMFDMWQRGRLRNKHIKNHPGFEIKGLEYDFLKKLLSS